MLCQTGEEYLEIHSWAAVDSVLSTLRRIASRQVMNANYKSQITLRQTQLAANFIGGRLQIKQ